jgi:hypothetical protein
MHETEAMQFIEPVLLGFLSRQFGYKEGEEPCKYEPHLNKIKAFIEDKEPYWVKEKSLYIIDDIEYAEISIQTGLYTPTSPDAFLNTIIDRVKEKLESLIKSYQLEQVKGKMSVFVPLPTFPK